MEMKAYSACMVMFLLILIAFQIAASAGETQPAIYGKVTDAETGLPIQGATVLIWDLTTNSKGIYYTNETGYYYASGPLIRRGDIYKIFIYKGNLTKLRVEYIPVVYSFKFSLGDISRNVSTSLLPGAMVILEGKFYTIHASSVSGRLFIEVVDPESGSPPQLGINYISEYGSSAGAYLLGVSRNVVIIPADIPVILTLETWIFVREYTLTSMFLYQTLSFRREYFTLDHGGKPFTLGKASKVIVNLSEYSLRHGVRVVNNKIEEVSSLLNEMRSIGFVVFEEKRSLGTVKLKVLEAERYLEKGNYTECWKILRDAFTRANLILLNLRNMRLVGMTNAVYMPAVLAIFSVILAFFFFEENRRKLISSIIIYVIFLLTFRWIYPGAPLIIKENPYLFLESTVISIAATLAAAFGIPRVWKERQVEGEVSLKSALAIIFSMGKRQIRRKKLRGFFTITSTTILVLAFTSLTSFGTVFGVVSDTINVTPPSDGILVKRLFNRTTILSSPLPMDDLSSISEMFALEDLAPRLENIPSLNPVARLINPRTGGALPIYGIEGIDPHKEPTFTHIDELIVKGGFLSGDGGEMLITSSIASLLGVDVNQTVTLYIPGVSGLYSNFTVKGILDSGGYEGLTDLDGQPFGPLRVLKDGSLRTCNSTEVVILNWRKARELQERVNYILGEGAPKLAVLHEIVFRPTDMANIKDIVWSLILSFDYDVFVSSNRGITYYYIGSYYEAKGAAELLIPLVMVGLNVGAVMLNAVYERRKELRVLSTIGLNPAHIAATFVAEAVIIGMVGGGLGYLFGLGFYRIMTLFGQSLMVREKLEWWWSAVSFSIAIVASILSSVRPAMLAVRLYTPSMVRKIKLPEKERRVRRKVIFKAYQARELSMPVKVQMNEMPFFSGYIINGLKELTLGTVERVENIEELPEVENVKGELVKTFKFDYYLPVMERVMGTKNEIICVKSPNEDYYRVRLVTKPAVPGMPEDLSLIHI